jgi:hypothetical protein
MKRKGRANEILRAGSPEVEMGKDEVERGKFSP